MGKVFKPEDIIKRRKVIDEALQDLTPASREVTKRILESWKGEESEKSLSRLLGDDETRRILKKVRF